VEVEVKEFENSSSSGVVEVIEAGST